MEFQDVVSTLRAMRRLHPDPVPEEDIWKILDTAIMAPSGGNTQPWNFVIIRDRATKEKIGEWYLDAWDKTYGPNRDAMKADPNMVRTFNSADHLANNLADAPVLILVTRKTDGMRLGTMGGASIYPAVQNLMLQARELGYGTTLTTLHMWHEKEVKELLGIPDGIETVALIPIGKPKGKFGKPARIPAEKVVFWDKWGAEGSRPKSSP